MIPKILLAVSILATDYGYASEKALGFYPQPPQCPLFPRYASYYVLHFTLHF